MSGISVGAKVNGNDPASKKALREALRDNPTSVEFYSTALVGEHVGEQFTGDKLPQGVRLDVTGPNPYNARAWWANVELVTGKGLRFDQKPIPAAKPAGGGKPGEVKLTGLSTNNVDALRETLTPVELQNVTLTASTAVFTVDAKQALAIVEQAKVRAATVHGGTGHPVQSLHSPVRKLKKLAGVS